MGSNQIVAVAEAIELALAMVEGDEVGMAQDFELEGAMKAFVLALGLRRLGANMGDPDPEPNQPHSPSAVKGCSRSKPHGAPLSISISAGKP